MKSTIILGGLMSLGGLLVSSVMAMPTDYSPEYLPEEGPAEYPDELTTELDARDVKTKQQECKVRVWQHSRRSDDKNDPYFLTVQLGINVEQEGSRDKQWLRLQKGLYQIHDKKNQMVMVTSAQKVDTKKKPGVFGAALTIKTPAVDDRSKDENTRRHLDLSFQFNNDKWSSNPNGKRCTIIDYKSMPQGSLLWNLPPGGGPVGYPGKEFRQIDCTFSCVLPEIKLPKQKKLKEQPKVYIKLTNEQKSSSVSKKTSESNGNGGQKNSVESKNSAESTSTQEQKTG